MVIERLILLLYKDFFNSFGYVEPSKRINFNLKDAGGSFHDVPYGASLER